MSTPTLEYSHLFQSDDVQRPTMVRKETPAPSEYCRTVMVEGLLLSIQIREAGDRVTLPFDESIDIHSPTATDEA